MTHVYDKLLRSAFESLPPAVQDAHLSPPVLSAAVEPDGDAFRLASPGEIEGTAPEPLVAKLGIKSWRDGGGLGVIYAGISLRGALWELLRRPTAPQRLAARAWTRTRTPLRVQLTRYRDFSNVSETRYLVHGNGCRRISACLRGDSGPHFDAAVPRLDAFARGIAAKLEPEAWILEIALLPDGAIGLVDVNPGLTPRDIAVLKA